MSTDTPQQTDIAVATCDNCKEPLLGLYCSNCGQKDIHYNRSIFLVVGDFFKELFDVDSYVFKSLFVLFFKPGYLSIEFLNNKRAQYIRPVRLYLFSSLVLFAVVAILAAIQEDADAAGARADTTLLAPSDADKERALATIERYIVTNPEHLEFDPNAKKIAAELLYNRKGTFITGYENVLRQRRIVESAKRIENAKLRDPLHNVKNLRNILMAAQDSEEIVNNVFEFTNSVAAAQIVSELLRGQNSLLKEPIIGMVKDFRTKKESGIEVSDFDIYLLISLTKIADNPTRVVDDMIESLPLLMFIVLPITVLVLATIQLGKGIRMVYQLIYAMHAHAVIFIVSLFGVLVTGLLPEEVVSVDITLWPILQLLLLVHTFWSFKKFYGSGFFVSVFKFLVVLFFYSIILVVGLILMFVRTVIFL